MSLNQLFAFGSQDIAIDLGTANTIVYLRGEGVVIDEPSVVAVEVRDGARRVGAVGDDAKLMMGKTPGTFPQFGRFAMASLSTLKWRNR